MELHDLELRHVRAYGHVHIGAFEPLIDRSADPEPIARRRISEVRFLHERIGHGAESVGVLRHPDYRIYAQQPL